MLAQFLHRYAFLFILTAICLTAFLAISLLSAQIFEYVPHSEDEVAYLFQAKVFARNRLAVPTPAQRQAFWTPFVVDYQGQRFGKYAPGWPVLLSLGVRLNTPWLVNALLATFTLALIAWLGYCFVGATFSEQSMPLSDPPRPWPQLGLWAATLGLLTPGFLLLSSSLLSHTASLFWSTLALATLFLLTQKDQTGYAMRNPFFSGITSSSLRPTLYPALTGAALGAAFITRPFAGVGIGLAIGIFLLVLIIRGEIAWTMLLWLALGGLALAILSPLYWWAVTGDPTFNAYLLVWPYDRVGFGPDIGPYGYTLSDALFGNTRLKLTALASGLFGWPGWSNLLFLPVPFVTRRANRLDWLLLGTILSLIFIHIFYWSFGGTDGGFPRYYYDALPAFLLLTIRGIQISGDILLAWSARLKRDRFQRGIPYSKLHWLPVGLALNFSVYNLTWNLPLLLAAQKGKYGITSAQLQAVEQAHLPTPALVIVKNVKKWSDFAAPFAANSPTLDGPVVYASDEGAAVTQALQKQFQERSCWKLDGENLKSFTVTRCHSPDNAPSRQTP